LELESALNYPLQHLKKYLRITLGCQTEYDCLASDLEERLLEMEIVFFMLFLTSYKELVQ
jgi:hypothetical protein